MNKAILLLLIILNQIKTKVLTLLSTYPGVAGGALLLSCPQLVTLLPPHGVLVVRLGVSVVRLGVLEALLALIEATTLLATALLP